jgi:hypothetical protein
MIGQKLANLSHGGNRKSNDQDEDLHLDAPITHDQAA